MIRLENLDIRLFLTSSEFFSMTPCLGFVVCGRHIYNRNVEWPTRFALCANVSCYHIDCEIIICYVALNEIVLINTFLMETATMYCASDKTIPGVSSSQSSKNVKDGKFVVVN